MTLMMKSVAVIGEDAVVTSRDFVYWLQGYFELKRAEGNLDKSQIVNISPGMSHQIEKHLAMVFYHEIDPSMGDKEHQGKLNEIHNGNQVDLSDPMIPPSVFLDTGYKPTSLDHTPCKSTVKQQDIRYRC